MADFTNIPCPPHGALQGDIDDLLYHILMFGCENNPLHRPNPFVKNTWEIIFLLDLNASQFFFEQLVYRTSLENFFWKLVGTLGSVPTTNFMKKIDFPRYFQKWIKPM